MTLLVAAGCKKATPPAGAGSGSAVTGAAATGSATVGSGSGSAGSAAPACDLAGTYRVRYQADGTDGYWLRFKVDGTPAKAVLDSPAQLLKLAPGPIDTAADLASCTLTLTANNAQVGDLKIVLAVDPKTAAVKGELTRTNIKQNSDSPSRLTGVRERTPGPIAAADACIAPGVYTLALDRKHAWKNTDAEDTRPCKNVVQDNVRPVTLRVEWLGDILTIDTVTDSAPWTELTYASEDVTRGAACDVELTLNYDAIEIETKLHFASGTFTGTATHAKAQVVEENGESESIWDCETSNLPLTARRIASP